MVLSELFIKLPYGIAWHIAKLFRKKPIVCFYAHEELDYEVFKNLHKLLPFIEIIAANSKLARKLYNKYEITAKPYPHFPDVLIMARHSLHKFPMANIKKIGMRHGPYHFKNFISAEKYNKFDMFLFTSEREVEEAKALGIRVAECGGFPKSDSLFDSELKSQAISEKEKIFGNSKPTLLFSSTWYKSGLSGVSYWYERVSELSDSYNILVTLHPWTDKKYVEAIQSISSVKFVDSSELYLYMLMSDLLIADTSSIIAEFMLLRRPIITFKIPPKGRLSQEIANMLELSTFRVSNFDELSKTIKLALESPFTFSDEVEKYLKIMFADGYGHHSEVASAKILDYLHSIGFELQSGTAVKI